MSDTNSTAPKKRYKSFRFQRFIAIGFVMTEPELKYMKPKEGETAGLAYCTFFASTGSPYGESSDAVFHTMLKGKNAEMFCKEPRKGHEFLFDLQLKTYEVAVEGREYPDRRTMFVGSFNFIGKKQDSTADHAPAAAPSAEQPAPAAKPRTNPVPPKSAPDEDIPF